MNELSSQIEERGSAFLYRKASAGITHFKANKSGNGNVALGEGIYFCGAVEDCSKLALRGNTIYLAEVDLGRCLTLRGEQYNDLEKMLCRLKSGHASLHKFRHELGDVDSIHWTGKTDASPDEYVVFDEGRVKNVREYA